MLTVSHICRVDWHITTDDFVTLSDLESPFHGSSVSYVWDRRANANALCTLSTLKSTSSALRGLSAVAELLVFKVKVLHVPVLQTGLRVIQLQVNYSD